MPRIKSEEAKKEFDAGNVVFVDSRPESAFKGEHLPGAISIPLGPDAADKFSQLPKGKKIIVYCTWPKEHTSASLAFQMNQKEIPGTYALEGGPPAWRAAGYPVEKSEWNCDDRGPQCRDQGHDKACAYTRRVKCSTQGSFAMPGRTRISSTSQKTFDQSWWLEDDWPTACPDHGLWMWSVLSGERK